MKGRGKTIRPMFLPLCSLYMVILADNNLWDRTLKFFWGLVKKRNPMPNTSCYTSALLACRKMRRWQEAIDLFRHIRREDIKAQPSEITYFQTMKTLVRVSVFLFFFL